MCDEYVSLNDPIIDTNTIEGYFSIFKRGIKGVCQHCAKTRLKRYPAEFDFGYNHRAAFGVEDMARSANLMGGLIGRRLTDRDSSAAAI